MYRMLSQIALIFCFLMMVGCAGKSDQYMNERYVHLDGGFNTRDLGGYPTVNDTTVKWQMLYRSDDLSTLTPEGIRQVKILGLKTIIDFRAKAEAQANHSLIHGRVGEVYSLPIDFGNMAELVKNAGFGDAQDYEQIMIDVNKHLVHSAQGQYREFFKIVMELSSAPLLFHCTAGKDRTGFAAALLLSSLGVEREIIFEDYLLSAYYLKQKYAFLLKEHPEFAPLVTVKRAYLEATFEEVEREYGSVENYLTNALEVDLQKMRELYTE